MLAASGLTQEHTIPSCPHQGWLSRGAVAWIAALGCGLAPAQSAPVFSTISVADGLPSQEIEDMVRDRHGYVWIGTQGGLVRHRGQAMDVLRHDPDDPHSLPGNNILALFADSRGSLWAGISGQGVVEVRGLRVHRHYPRSSENGPLEGEFVWSFAEDCDGAIWLAYARGGLARIEPDSGTVRHFPAGTQYGIPDESFNMELLVDSSCRLWLTQFDGLLVSESVPELSMHRLLSAEDVPGEMIQTIVEVGPGEFWVGARRGLLRFGPVDRPAEWTPGQAVRYELPDIAAEIVPDGSGGFWLASVIGLRWFEPESGRTMLVQHQPGLRDGLPGPDVFQLLAGGEGELWVGTAGSGVALLSPGWRGFERFERVSSGDSAGLKLVTVTAIAEAGPGTQLWLGSRGDGVQWIDLEAGLDRHYRLEGKGGDAASFRVIGLHRPSQRDGVWVLQSAKLLWLDPADERGEVVLTNQLPWINGEILTFLAPGPDESMWLGAGRAGLLRLDEHGALIERWHPNGEGHYHLAELDPNQIVKGPDGRWWLRGEYTVYVLEASGRFAPATPPASLRTQVMAWSEDELWLASDSLLQSFRLSAGRLVPIRRITPRDGLPVGRIVGLFPEASGALWMTLSTGLARFDPGDGSIRVFTRSEGLPATEFERRAGLRLADGRIAAGTARGLLLISPEQIGSSGAPPPVHVTALRAGDRRIEIEPGYAAPIELGWRENSIELEFVALSFLDPQRNRTRLRLNGWDKDWIEQVGTTRQFYSNLPSGAYRFEILAANSDGLWGESGAALDLVVGDPPWRSTTAWLAYWLVAVTGAGFGWRTVTVARRRRAELRRIRDQRRIAEHQQRFLARLNHNLLDPAALAAEIGAELLRVSQAKGLWIGYLDPDFPNQVWALGSIDPPAGRSAFDAWLSVARKSGKNLVEFRHGQRVLAAALLESATKVDEAEVSLISQTAEQALENARLMENVRHLADHAQRASDAKSEFLATMSHEIRTPLHGLLGMMELLEQSAMAPEQRDMVMTAATSGQHLRRILDDVLDLSRIEAGRIELQAHVFDLVELLEQLVDLHASSAARAGLDLRLRMASDLPVIARGDSDRFAQVIGNLLNNAIKFTHSGWVELEARADSNGGLVLSCTDTGPGIEQAAQDLLFQPFTRTERALTRRHSGTGLGLAICRRLVEAMGGTIELVSRPGHGTRFTVRAPLLPPMAASLRPSTRLLQGLVLATDLCPGHWRIVHRLARRWGIVLGRQGQPADLVLIDFERGELAERVARYGAGQVLVWGLPGGLDETLPDGAKLLRWPLNETRFVGALLDGMISRRRPV